MAAEDRLKYATQKSQCAILFLTKRYSDKVCVCMYVCYYAKDLLYVVESILHN